MASGKRAYESQSYVMMTTAGNSRQKVMETIDDGNA